MWEEIGELRAGQGRGRFLFVYIPFVADATDVLTPLPVLAYLSSSRLHHPKQRG